MLMTIVYCNEIVYMLVQGYRGHFQSKNGFINALLIKTSKSILHNLY